MQLPASIAASDIRIELPRRVTSIAVIRHAIWGSKCESGFASCLDALHRRQAADFNDSITALMTGRQFGEVGSIAAIQDQASAIAHTG